MSPFRTLPILFPLLCLAACVSRTVGAEVEHRVAEGALGPYSGAVLAGDFVFVSGKIGERGGSFAREAETSIAAVEAELGSLGLDLSDVVESRVFLTDIERYSEFNEIYARLFPAPYPARACVAVAALPGGARVEVQCVARRR